MRDEEPGDVHHTVAVLSIMDPADARLHETRLVFRAREFIEFFQPDAMR